MIREPHSTIYLQCEIHWSTMHKEKSDWVSSEKTEANDTKSNGYSMNGLVLWLLLLFSFKIFRNTATWNCWLFIFGLFMRRLSFTQLTNFTETLIEIADGWKFDNMLTGFWHFLSHFISIVCPRCVPCRHCSAARDFPVELRKDNFRSMTQTHTQNVNTPIFWKEEIDEKKKRRKEKIFLPWPFNIYWKAKWQYI